jgi:hypothetical protein
VRVPRFKPSKVTISMRAQATFRDNAVLTSRASSRKKVKVS